MKAMDSSLVDDLGLRTNIFAYQCFSAALEYPAPTQLKVPCDL